jgi:hypothetical protein
MLIRMTVEVPPYQHFLWPALQAVIALGGSASIAELDAAVPDRENLSPKVMDTNGCCDADRFQTFREVPTESFLRVVAATVGLE